MFFIVFEGIDGSGKSTQAELFSQYLTESVLTVEPTEGPIGKILRNYLSSSEKVPTPVYACLFAADRALHVEEIENLQNTGKTVICDRYLMSSMAYQGDGKPFDTHQIYSLNDGDNLSVPDLTFYLKIDPQVAMERISARGSEQETFEKLETLKAVSNRYEESISSLDWKVIEIDASQDMEAVSEAIKTAFHIHVENLLMPDANYSA